MRSESRSAPAGRGSQTDAGDPSDGGVQAVGGAQADDGAQAWLAGVPVLDHLADAADPARYAALPDDWVIGVADVVDSTGAIAAGRYKAVNLAGAASIGAVANALGGRLALFVFGGDGAGFAVPAADAGAAAAALSRVAMWARRELDLTLRVGIKPVAGIRAAGADVRVALWRASAHVRYAMFSGGGLERAEAELKSGAIGLAPAGPDEEPDLTGLSCRWGPVRPTRGKILSLIVKPAPGAPARRVTAVVRRVIRALEDAASVNPVPAEGPELYWPSAAQVALHARLAAGGRRRLPALIGQLALLPLVWLVFRLGLRLGRFDAARYRREMSHNSDFRKFSDGLMMTLDCTPRAAARVRVILAAAARQGLLRYGLHLQDEALVTCFVPSPLAPDHMHFVDGAGGGYARAAGRMRVPGQRRAAAGASGGRS